MSTLSCTIGGISNLQVLNASPQDTEQLEVNGQLQITIIDGSGIYSFTRGQPVTYSDSVSGIMFSGFVVNDVPQNLSPDVNSTTILHVVTAQGGFYRLSKQANKTNYFNTYAGDIATDMVVNGALSAEGVTVPANIHRDSTAANFNTGILNGTAGYTTTTGDGDLALLKAGSDLTIIESVTGDFASGTLTNVTAASNALSPTTQSTIKFTAVLQAASTGATASVQIWSGSQVVGTLDTLNYGIWIDGSSAAKTIGVEVGFNDGTFLSATTSAVDQNGLPAAPTSDLSSYATGQWYNRAISFPSSLNGKTISSVSLVTDGQTAGNYLAYFKNIYLTSASGSPFFSTTATATSLNPPVITSINIYVPTQVATSIVQTFDPANAYRISPAHSIDSVKLLSSSLITWIGTVAGTSAVQLWASYDGVSYSQCTNNTALPNFPSGSVTASLNLYLKEVFTTSSSGTLDPTQIPSLSYVSVSLVSAPNPTSAKFDIVTGYGTQSAWNTGTYAGTASTTGGDLTIGATTRDWNDHLITNQTFTVNGGSPTQSASTGAYVITLPASASAFSNMDFVGQVVDFTWEMDVTMGTGVNVQLYYRNLKKNLFNPATSYNFIISTQTTTVTFQLINAGTITNIATGTFTFTAGTTYHMKIVASGPVHQIYIAGSSTPLITAYDGTLTNIGYIGVEALAASSSSATFDNLSVIPSLSGTWTSSSISLASLVTCGPSVISWTPLNVGTALIASVLVQTSVDGGSTFQTCTNGGSIPNLPSGTNVSSKSVIVKISMTALSQITAPIIRQLVWRVLGQYPGSTGTRSTAPMVIDTLARANVSGSWGTSNDGQSITKNGTGTVNLTSNEGLIANTTGDCNMVYGSRTATDQEATVRFQLSASGTSGGIELRYVDASNFYRLSANTTTLSIQQKRSGSLTTITSSSVSLSTGVYYRMRFRVVGSGPVNFWGRVWADGVLEPTTWNVTGSA